MNIKPAEAYLWARWYSYHALTWQQWHFINIKGHVSHVFIKHLYMLGIYIFGNSVKLHLCTASVIFLYIYIFFMYILGGGPGFYYPTASIISYNGHYVCFFCRDALHLWGVRFHSCCRGNKRLCQTLVRRYWPTLFCIFAPSLLIKYEPPQTDSLFVFWLFFSHRLDSTWRKTRNLTLLASAGEEFLILCSFIRPRLRSFTTTGHQKTAVWTNCCCFCECFMIPVFTVGYRFAKLTPPTATAVEFCCVFFSGFTLSRFSFFHRDEVTCLKKNPNSSCYGEITLCDAWRCFVPLWEQQ